MTSAPRTSATAPSRVARGGRSEARQEAAKTGQNAVLERLRPQLVTFRDEVESEARRMLDFAAADAAAREIRFDAAPG